MDMSFDFPTRKPINVNWYFIKDMVYNWAVLAADFYTLGANPCLTFLIDGMLQDGEQWLYSYYNYYYDD